MSIYHCSMKNGGVGKGKAHAQYTAAEGKYAAKSDLIAKLEMNIPDFADSASDFFAAADKHERKNGRTYKEFELSLPNEFTHSQNVAVINDFVVAAKLQKQPIQAGFHSGRNGQNHHCHLMFSERPNAKFSAEKFFKRNGSKKDRTFNSANYLIESRKTWETVLNKHLELNGFDEKVSCETLANQGIQRIPQPKIGFAALAIEAKNPGTSDLVQNFEEVLSQNIDNQIIFEHEKAKKIQLESLVKNPTLQASTLKQIDEIKGLKAEVAKLQSTEIREPRIYKNLTDFVKNAKPEIVQDYKSAKMYVEWKKEEIKDLKWYQMFEKRRLEKELPDLQQAFVLAKKDAVSEAKSLNKSRKVGYKNRVADLEFKLESASREMGVLEAKLENRFGLKSDDLKLEIEQSDVAKNQVLDMQREQKMEWQQLEQSCQSTDSGFDMC